MHSAPSPAAHRCACGGPPFIGRSGWLRVILQFMFNFAGNSSHLSLFAARAIRVRMTAMSRADDPSSQSQSVPSPVTFRHGRRSRPAGARAALTPPPVLRRPPPALRPAPPLP